MVRFEKNRTFFALFFEKCCINQNNELSLHYKQGDKPINYTTMATMTKQYTVSAISPKYGETTVTLTLEFNNENNTSVITVCDGFIMGGQTSGYTAEAQAMANSKVQKNSIKLYSLKALTKLGTNHLYLYKSDEVEQNKQTRFVCELTGLALTIKNDVYNWRKSLSNE